MSKLSQPRPLVYWRVLLGITFLLTLPALNGVFISAQLANASKISRSNWAVLIGSLVFLGLAVLILFGLTWLPYAKNSLGRLELFASNNPFRLIPAYSLLILVSSIFPLLMLTPESGVLLGETWLRWYLLWWLAILSSVLLKIIVSRLTWTGAFVASLILLGVIIRIASYLPDVTSYPLSIGWSEASRYYDASLLFGQRIYGQPTSLAVLHPALHLLLAVPFLFGDFPIWVHRLWMVSLTLALSFVIGLLLAQRLALKLRAMAIVFAGWAFLFLMQGPIYLHLTIPIIIVLYGFDSKNFTKSLVAVFLASLWVGISRINWFPVPAMLAMALYFLKTSVNGQKWFIYLKKPGFWLILGILTAFASQIIYIIFSGGDLLQFYSSTSSPLLWYRLWPNVTYPPGIMLGSALVSLPLWLVFDWVIVKNHVAINFLRLLGLVTILLVLFTGGLVVSIKIGGGGDLHNMDAYLILLMIISSVFFFGEFEPESERSHHLLPVPWVFTFFAVLIPVWLATQSLAPWPERDFNVARIVVDAVRYRSGLATRQGGKVLFIAERQLLTFGDVNNVPLLEEYERDFLTEMVMSRNEKYLSRFYQDLHQHRFALIIAESQGYYLSKQTSAFNEENDLWINSISAPLLCEYKQTKMPGGYSYFVPRPGPTNCKFP